MRWRWPPENSCGYLSRSAGAQAHRQPGPRWRGGAVRRGTICVSPCAEQVARTDDALHGLARVQRAIGILEHHLEVAPARGAQLGCIQRVQVAAVQHRTLPLRGLVQRHHQPRQRRLARARFAHDAQAAPASMVKLTPFRACTSGRRAEQLLARHLCRCAWRLSTTCSSGAVMRREGFASGRHALSLRHGVQPQAARLVAVTHRQQPAALWCAHSGAVCKGAAPGKWAARRQVDQLRHRAGNRRQAPAACAEPRPGPRAEQAARE
jgi:hypothetical protein